MRCPKNINFQKKSQKSAIVKRKEKQKMVFIFWMDTD
jgi:hypothetical protein